MYPNPHEAIAIGNEEPWDDPMYDKAQLHVEAFYTEVVLVLAEYGEIEEVVVVDNTADYQLGNVYVKYYHDEAAEKALRGLTGRFYFGKLIDAEYSPVTDFREARCRAFHETRCSRGGACRFLHIKHIPTAIKRRVAREMYDDHPEYLGKTSKKHKKKRKLEPTPIPALEGGKEAAALEDSKPRRRYQEGPAAIEDGGSKSKRRHEESRTTGSA